MHNSEKNRYIKRKHFLIPARLAAYNCMQPGDLGEKQAPCVKGTSPKTSQHGREFLVL